jgi:23S rRNA pseudouridine1911/1915/1917 synthase
MLVHGDETGDVTLADLVKEYIRIRYDKPGDVFLGTIHRIDRPTSGVIIFARTSKALERMNKLLAEQKVAKTYYAVIRERPMPIVGEIDGHFLLKVNPHTGRQHQIRAQLSKAGYPILGDLKYGSERPHADGRSIYLHCYCMAFEHPVQKTPVKIEAYLPEEDRIWNLMSPIIDDIVSSEIL